MDKKKLSTALRNLASQVVEHAEPGEPQYEDIKDAAELVRALARVVEGQSIERAFGAPGDWGYDTPVGDALAS